MPIRATMPFEKWGLDYIGPIKPASSTRKNYIFVATDYFTKWAEAKALVKYTKYDAAKFLIENIITRFGAPTELVSDRESHFMNELVEELVHQFAITCRKSSPYYPQLLTNKQNVRYQRQANIK